MTSLFWSDGHLGWLFFGIVVLSVLCLLATDIVWRVIPTSFRKVLLTVAILWGVGAGAMFVLWYV